MKPEKLILVFAFLVWQFQGFSQRFTSHQFLTEDGLPDAYIYASFQDQEGFLWSATTKGLVKFDGQVFTNCSPALPEGDFIYTGVSDGKGRLWFGTFAGRLFTLDKGKSKLEPYKDSIAGSVDRIIISSNGQTVYFVSKGGGIFVLKNSKIAQVKYSQIYQVNSVIELKPGLLLLATPEGLYKADTNNEKVQKINGAELDITQVQATGSKNKFLLAVNGKGIVEALADESFDNVILTEPKGFEKVKDLGISYFYYHATANLLYIATRDEAFHVFDSGDHSLRTFPREDFLATANSILVDGDQNVWISTAGKGLYRFFREEYRFIDLGGQPVYGIARDNDSLTYYATGDGIWVMNARQQLIRTIKQIGTTKLEKVNALYFDGRKLWVGTEGKGLFILDPMTLKPLQLEFSAIGNISVNSITGSSNKEEVYVSTNLEGAYIYRNYALKNHFSVQNSLLHNNVYFALMCSDDNVYYATHNTAINFSRGNQVYEMNVKDNGLVSDFNTFAEGPGGNLAIGTNGGGVYFLKDTVMSLMPQNDKLESKYCNTLIYDKNGNLWIALRYSLYKYNALTKTLKKIELGSDNSLLFNPNSFYADKNGELLFGTSKNALIFKEGGGKMVLPKSYLLSVKMFDSVITNHKAPVLKHGVYDFAFEFSALCLRNSEEVTFSYILEGRDNKWSEPSRLRKAEFYSLGEGTYTFKVRAYDREGFAGDEVASYTFTISPPIWKNTWFWIVVMAMLIGLMYAIVKVRTASLVRAKIKLERLVDEKTMELRKEKELVEMKNTVIEEQNKDITSSITYAKRIQEAILPDKRLNDQIKGNILIYYIPKDIVSGDFYWIAEKNKRFLFAACDCTGHGVPGAFMSLIGTTLFNKIVFDNNEAKPNSIIYEMDREISKSLRQEDTEVNDGMEAGLCSVDFETGNILYTGAKRPLFLCRKGENGYVLEEYKADKFPIGGFTEIKDKSFTLNAIDAREGDMLYMFSDGIIDQFNRQGNKRFSTKRLRELLLSIAHLPVAEQWQMVNNQLNEWKGETVQTDDILLLGVRF